MPFDASDDELRSAIAHADVVSLLPALAYATGDLSLLRDDLRIDKANIRQPDAGLTPEQVATARDLAFEALVRLRDGETEVATRPPSKDDLRRMIEFFVGEGADDDYVHLVEEELGGLDGEDLRAPRWHRDDLAPGREFHVVVVGAGMSGLLVGHRLDQAGVRFTIVEKNDDVGGTWYENTYPGARVDVPNHLYSYSFAQRHDWPSWFSTQPVLQRYFRDCAERFGLLDRIRFETEVLSCTFDEATATWAVRVRHGGGEETLTAHVVVSAVGQLNRPNMPDIAGMERFAGPSFHSARWDASVDLDGKRVAVVGTGASACQLVPEIADRVASLTVFQRTPPWLVPSLNYHEEVPEPFRWLLANVPSYSHWYRFWQFWRTSDGLLHEVEVDPSWDGGGRSVSAANDALRQLLEGWIRLAAGGDEELAAKCTPTYPPGAKRVIFDNGAWLAALQKDHVTLVDGGIREITPQGIVDGDGALHEVDVIVYGTGFRASQFLTPMQVVGRGGADLHETWDGDARAYLGITVPGFPNLFLMYGPNTNIVVNGSIIFFSECEAHYVLQCVRHLLATGGRALDVRAEVHDAYNERIDAGNRAMAWGASDVNTWYRNAKGRIAQNWPFTLLEYWQQTRDVRVDDYEVL